MSLMAGAAIFAPMAQGQAGAAVPLITQAIDETKLTTLTGNTYPQAKPQYDLGTAPATLPMERMLLVLKRSPAQDFALRRLMDQQHDPSSPNYHKWLTPDEFGQQFGPTDSDMKVITTWLESHGFRVGTTRGRTVLEFSGSASQVQEAFHTTIHKYLVNGVEHWANASDPQIPTALTPAVAGIDSLHDFRRKAMNEFVGKYSEKTKQLANRGPQYTVCQGTECDYAVSPYDFATIYDLLPLWNAATDGSGQTIAIVGRSWINPSDATTFWQIFGLTVPANKLTMIANGIQPEVNGDEAEADIDVQWSGAVAPQATIDFVSSQSTTTSDGIDLSALYIIENNLAPVMSESFGECELGLGTAGNEFYYALWGQAAAQGISVFISAGDNGAAGCDNPGDPAQYGLNVNGLASTPFNAAIGGTDFNEYNTWSAYWNSSNNSTTQESAKSYIPETTWNDSCTNALAITLGYGNSAEQACNNAQMIQAGGVNSTGGSGGASACVVNSEQLGSCTAGYEKPSWQKGTGVPNDNLRDLPDASLFASNGFLGSFYVICEQDATGGECNLDALAGYGGTSVASPAFAGIMALVNQKTGEAQGVPGFSLYQLATKEPSAFHDVPAGSTIAMPCITGSLNCDTTTAGDQYGVLSGYSTTAGFDLATGLGSVDATNLVNNWSKATFTSSTTALTLNNGTAVNEKHGTAVPVKIAVSPSAATGVAALVVGGSGTVTGAGIDSFALSGGSSTGTTSVLPGGTYNVVAHYGGDGTYGGSYSSPVSVTISKENSTVDFPGLEESGGVATTSVTYDNYYWFRVDVQNSAGQFCNPAPIGEIACPTGTIALTDNANSLGTYPISTEGAVETASLSPPIVLSGGTHTLKASYSGDNSYNAGSSSVVVTVNKASTNTSTPSVQATNFTQPVSMTVLVQDPNSVQGIQAAPTGTVTFYSSGTALTGTVSYSTGSGANFGLYATLSHTFSAAGTYQITATYSGDQNYSTSTSSATPLTLQYPAPSVLLTPASQITAAGSTASVTALVDTTNKTAYPTGAVTFVSQTSGATLAGPVTCANAKDGSGNYACQAVGSFTVPNSIQVIANYGGDTNYPASTSTAVTVSVPDFSVGTSVNGTVPVTQGGETQPITVSISPLSGFNGVVSFSCSGLPAEATCGFSPATVTGSGSTTLTITTAALGQAQQQRKARPMRGAGGFLGTMIFVLGAGLVLVPRSRRRGAAAMLMIAAVLVTLPGCGGGGSGQVSSNPVPAITSLSPTQQAAGSQSQALMINGSGFVTSSQATFNGVSHATSFVSASQVTIALSASDMANQGSYPVVVTNPSPGGGASSGVNFNVVSGTPVGTFTVTVNATSGSLSHTTTFSLVVTQ